MVSVPVVYRLHQGVKALFAFAQPVEWTLAERYLKPSLLELFRQMNRDEQLHSLAVLRDVLAQGLTPDELAVAALLHDLGKSCYPIGVWQKTFAVIVRAIAPKRYYQWSLGNPLNLWERPFVVYEQHPAWGANMVRDAGASEAVCWLIREHAHDANQLQRHPYGEWLRRLQQADNQN